MTLHQTEVKVTANREKIIVEGKGDKILAALATAFIFIDNLPEDELFSTLGEKLNMSPNSRFFLKITDKLVESNINVEQKDAKNVIAAVIDSFKIEAGDFLELYYSIKDIMLNEFKSEFKTVGTRLKILQMILSAKDEKDV